MNTVKRSFLAGRVTLDCGDITHQKVDAIVNAANSSLLGGGGVDGAIHRAGGPEILSACMELRRTTWPDGLPTGKAVITTGGNLPARHVIHTVGPIYGQHAGQESRLLADCYFNSIELAAELGLQSLAFPAISTGAFGYPPEEAAGIVSQTLTRSLKIHLLPAEIRLIFFDPTQRQVFLTHQLFPD